jgi:predicted alpha/beta-hydrolase family hydrolase
MCVATAKTIRRRDAYPASMQTIYLAHGASGSAASMLPHVAGLANRGLSAVAVQLPRGRAEAAVATYRAAALSSPNTVIGGHSFGGRVASLVAAEERYGGLILLSYPLHPPGAVERWDERTAHWPRIACPVLLLSGDRDPFARVALLREAVERLPVARLVVYPGIRHGIGPVQDQALDEIAAFVRSLPASEETRG